jgi:hypothetical protein
MITTSSGVAIFDAVVHGEELLAVVVRRDLHLLADPLERGIGLQVRFLAGRPPHLHAGEDEERAEQIQDPVELRDQPGAHQDHDRAQHERAEDADHQHALLELRGHRKVGEHHQEHEDVVDRERFFHQVAGDELERLGLGELARRGIGAGAAQIPPEPAHEDERHHHPDQRPDRSLAGGDLVRALLAHGEEIDEKRHEDERGKQHPHQRGADGHHGERPFVSGPARPRSVSGEGMPVRSCLSAHVQSLARSANAVRTTLPGQRSSAMRSRSVLTTRWWSETPRLLPF